MLTFFFRMKLTMQRSTSPRKRRRQPQSGTLFAQKPPKATAQSLEQWAPTSVHFQSFLSKAGLRRTQSCGCVCLTSGGASHRTESAPQRWKWPWKHEKYSSSATCRLMDGASLLSNLNICARVWQSPGARLQSYPDYEASRRGSSPLSELHVCPWDDANAN